MTRFDYLSAHCLHGRSGRNKRDSFDKLSRHCRAKRKPRHHVNRLTNFNRSGAFVWLSFGRVSTETTACKRPLTDGCYLRHDKLASGVFLESRRCSETSIIENSKIIIQIPNQSELTECSQISQIPDYFQKH